MGHGLDSIRHFFARNAQQVNANSLIKERHQAQVPSANKLASPKKLRKAVLPGSGVTSPLLSRSAICLAGVERVLRERDRLIN